MAEKRVVFNGPGQATLGRFVGPVHVSFYGEFNGGTAEVHRIDSVSDMVPIAGTDKKAAADFMIDFPVNSARTLVVVFDNPSPTSPPNDFIAELRDGY